MPKYKLVILEQTVSEFEKACLYYDAKVSGLGHEFEQEIVAHLELIRSNPLHFPIKFAHIREVNVKRFPFVINYELLDEQIVISAIFHTKQNPRKKIKRKRR